MAELRRVAAVRNSTEGIFLVRERSEAGTFALTALKDRVFHHVKVDPFL